MSTAYLIHWSWIWELELELEWEKRSIRGSAMRRCYDPAVRSRPHVTILSGRRTSASQVHRPERPLISGRSAPGQQAAGMYIFTCERASVDFLCIAFWIRSKGAANAMLYPPVPHQHRNILHLLPDRRHHDPWPHWSLSVNLENSLQSWTTTRYCSLVYWPRSPLIQGLPGSPELLEPGEHG